MNGRKSGNTGGGDSDRKPLTGREVERLIEAAKCGEISRVPLFPAQPITL
jgi:hypothetical protein